MIVLKIILIEKMKKIILALSLAIVGASAVAADPIYAGGSIGRAHQKMTIEDAGSRSENTTGGKLFVGTTFGSMLGVEAGVVGFGKATISGGGASISADPTALYIAGTARFAMSPTWSVFGKLGAARTHTKLSASIPGFTDSTTNNETSLMGGVGVSYAVSPTVSVVAEYENFGKVAKDAGDSLKADLLSVGVRFNF